MKTLPTNVVSTAFKTKLRPRFIGPSKVVTKKGLLYTLNLLHNFCTHSVFQVGVLQPYRDSTHVNVEALAPRAVTSESGRQDDPPSESAAVSAPATASAPLPACPEYEAKSQKDISFREATQRALAPIHPPPPVLLDGHGIL